MKKIILLVGAMLCIQWYMQRVDHLVYRIANNHWSIIARLDPFGWPYDYIHCAQIFKARASKKKLHGLLDHESGTVVASAALALMEREEVDPQSLLERFILDERSIITSYGCMPGYSTLPEIIYEGYRTHRTDFSFYSDEPEDYDFLGNEKLKLDDSPILQSMDEFLLYHAADQKLLMSYVLENRIYQGENLERIKYLAYEKHQVNAIAYLFENHLSREEANLEKLLKILAKQSSTEDYFYEDRLIEEMLKQLEPEKIPAIDSIQILSYDGGKILAPPPPPGLEDRFSKNDQDYEEYLQDQFPQYDSARDMQLPPMTRLLMDVDHKFHPTINWESKKVLLGEELKDFLALLNCEEGKLVLGETAADSFNPRHGVIVYSGGKIQEIFSIGLECKRVKKTNFQYENYWPNSQVEYNIELDCIDYTALKKALVAQGFPGD